MKRTFPASLKYLGLPAVIAVWLLAARLVWEQTALSWERGPQMIGFSLMHSGLGALLLLAVVVSFVWFGAVIIAAAVSRSLGGTVMYAEIAAYLLACSLLIAPYGVWQRLFISKYSPAQAVDFLTYAAATGDVRTVQAFLDHGVEVNAQGRSGTALHGAAVEGSISVIELLLGRGADVNAINAYGDSPLANAMEAREHSVEVQALLQSHGAKLVRGTEEQRARVIKEEVARDIEQIDKESRQ